LVGISRIHGKKNIATSVLWKYSDPERKSFMDDFLRMSFYFQSWRKCVRYIRAAQEKSEETTCLSWAAVRVQAQYVMYEALDTVRSRRS
jgi:hypothetical protein